MVFVDAADWRWPTPPPLAGRPAPVFVVIDSLVHNFLHRTGILQAPGPPDHPYGPGCYRPGGVCRRPWRTIAAGIDARQFNPTFPGPCFLGSCSTPSGVTAPRTALNICNGNQIKDEGPCDNKLLPSASPL